MKGSQHEEKDVRRGEREVGTKKGKREGRIIIGEGGKRSERE